MNKKTKIAIALNCIELVLDIIITAMYIRKIRK